MLTSFFFATLPLSSLAVFLLSATDVIASLFYLVATYAWLRYLRTNSNRWFAATFVCFLLGLFSKEFVVTLPVVLLLLDLIIVKRTTSILDLIRRYVWFGVANIVSSYLTVLQKR
ncbi:MAG: glycosyltransferase family 39 protein [Chloroflexi bacterium]|nr:glycosyltransferase family 39 protein [Chloroflexota bacterium]